MSATTTKHALSNFWIPCDDIREALLLGLSCYGENIERQNSAECAKLCGQPWPDEAIPIGIEDAGTVTKFAAALMYVDSLERHLNANLESESEDERT